MKKLVYLVVSLFFVNIATAQNDGFFRKTKVINGSGDEMYGFVPALISQANVGDTLYKMGKVTSTTGDEVNGWIPYIVPNNKVEVSKNKVDGNDDKFEFDKNKDYNLRKKEMQYGHEENMKDKDVQIVEAKANGGRWQKRERIVVISGNSYGNPYYSQYNPIVATGYVATGSQTGYTIVQRQF